jgi:hypothetical protein
MVARPTALDKTGKGAEYFFASSFSGFFTIKLNLKFFNSHDAPLNEWTNPPKAGRS